jgi:ABC-type amino acid transport substrate-binding protein
MVKIGQRVACPLCFFKLTSCVDTINRHFLNRFFLFLICLTSICRSQSADTLFINYYSHSPFAYSDAGQQKGIEVEIMNEYIFWLKSKKKISTSFRYNEFADFNSFYSATRRADKNTVGLGAVTISPERAREVDFSTPYLKNVAFCITNGNAPDVKTKTSDEIVRALGSMSAITMSSTSLEKYVNELRKGFLQDIKVQYREDEIKILDEISSNVLTFGYVDAVAFWFYLKNNPRKFLKVQKILSQSKEECGMIMPRGSKHKALFDEFFSAPGGFKASPTYRAILEKYLGSYMTQNVAVN